jgi:hypothetical protein
MEMDVVRESEQGRITMTNGPFLEASIEKAGPGDQVTLKDGTGTLRIKVQCANWLDVDHVGVFVNGRLAPTLEWTRESHPDFFEDGVVKFERGILLKFTTDTHVIVAAHGDNASTAPVMGQGSGIPLAITNPIFVDADGDGKFTPNKDWLETGKPPVKPEWAW